MVSNIDFLPTMLDLAGIEYAVNDYDGMSWLRGGILNASNHLNDKMGMKWRDRLLIQYAIGGSKSQITDFSHCQTWFPAEGQFQGFDLHPPGSNSLGQRWITNDGTNNWRAIRILNETVNVVYAEFVNDYDNLTLLHHPDFIEFYNIDSDPYQMDNVYRSLDDSVKGELHEMLMEYAVCSGTDCW